MRAGLYPFWIGPAPFFSTILRMSLYCGIIVPVPKEGMKKSERRRVMVIKPLYSYDGVASNCYLVSSKNEAILFDASVSPDQVKKELGTDKLLAVVLTHGHFDHMLRLSDITTVFQVPSFIHVGDRDFPSDGLRNAHILFYGTDMDYGEVNETFEDGHLFHVGDEEIRVLNTPGHTIGSCVFFTSAGLITGDTLFASGHGRTDLYSGDDRQMAKSLVRLSEYDGKQRIYPGHGALSTLSHALWECGITGRYTNL